MRTFRTYVVDEAAGVVAGLVSLPDARIVHLIFNCGTRGSKAGKYERPVSFSCRGAEKSALKLKHWSTEALKVHVSIFVFHPLRPLKNSRGSVSSWSGGSSM